MPAFGLASSRPVGLPLRVAHDLAAGRLGRVLGVADGAQRGAVEQRAVVEMQQEHRRVGRDGVELVDGRQALLGELMLGEAADHAHPLRRRRDRDLPLQHGHRVGEAAHAVPAQLHVEVEPAADDVQVVVDQAGQHAAALEVDDPRVAARPAARCPRSWPTRSEAAVLDGDRTRGRIAAIQRGEPSVMQDQIRAFGIAHDVLRDHSGGKSRTGQSAATAAGCYLCGTVTGTTYSGSLVDGAPCTIV